MVREGGMGVIVFSWDLTKGHQSCVACAGVIAHITRPADGAADRGDWKNRAFSHIDGPLSRCRLRAHFFLHACAWVSDKFVVSPCLN